ncbi:alpha-L-fucosidase [Parabacteroides goldsteinii]|uniref:alpha-L-fucosidase n=2 Tax=Parabacteroides goldsteinii TaxID=328812 RepID=UPI002570EBAE|nr:alpha-L-fucosidase [Parabacteroides goldsteinii]
MKKVLGLALSCLLSVNGYAQKYEPTFASLQQYECPEWIQKAKFGIYCHWNAQSASKSPNNGWDAREMYIEGSPAYKDHLRNWGHPSEVGYKDIVMVWKGDKFDAKEWVSLFKNAGAKFVLTMAVHHDNFDMWDSKYQPKWNSTNYGPKQDVCKAVRDEALKAGLRWGVTTHLERTYSWVQTNKGADKEGPKAGVPYDGNLKEYQDLYIEYPNFANLGNDFCQLRTPLVSPQSWKDMWRNRLQDLIENYHPDFFYIDGALPYTDDGGKVGFELEAFYLNHNASRHNGVNEGFWGIKDISHHGVFYPGTASTMLERAYSNTIQPEPKLSDESIGAWFHTGVSEYYSSKKLISLMVDVVSKNCIFLLNVPPKADGSFDKEAVDILNGIGRWMQINGDAIYETKPWKTFGEGSVRYTTKENTLNAIVCSELKSDLLLASLKDWKVSDIRSIKLLGSNEKVNFEVTDMGILIHTPQSVKDSDKFSTFQIECKNLDQQPFTVINLQSVKKLNEEASKKFGATGNSGAIPLP